MLAAAQAGDGVKQVEATVFRRQGETSVSLPDELTTGRLEEYLRFGLEAGLLHQP